MKRSRPLTARTYCRACGKTLCSCGSTLRRKQPPRTRTALPKRNEKRRKRRFARDFHSSAYVEWLHGMPCAVCGVSGWTVAAHTKSRGAGGKASDLVPLCSSRLGVEGCHELLDTKPWKLAEGTVDRLRRLSSELWRRWCERNPNEGST